MTRPGPRNHPGDEYVRLPKSLCTLPIASAGFFDKGMVPEVAPPVPSFGAKPRIKCLHNLVSVIVAVVDSNLTG